MTLMTGKLEFLMENRRTILLVGDSLLMDTVEASLNGKQELGVMRLHSGVGNMEECIKSLSPDMVIFDWDTSFSQFALSMLRDQPGVPLLGLDVSSSTVIVLSSQQFTPLSVSDLTLVIQMQASRQTRHIESGHVVWGRRGIDLLQ